MAAGRFSKNAANRVARATVRIERSRIGDAPSPPSRGAGAAQLGILRAYVTTAIPTGTWSSPSSTGAVMIAHLGSDGVTWVEEGPYQVFNDMKLAASAPAGTVVRVSYISGQVWTVGGECY